VGNQLFIITDECIILQCFGIGWVTGIIWPEKPTPTISECLVTFVDLMSCGILSVFCYKAL